jgi:hypothetical protein
MSDARSAVLAGESAAIYAYGVIIGQTDGARRRRAETSVAAHRRWRDRWVAQFSTEPSAAVAYDLPDAVGGADADTLAALVENRLVALYADLAAASAGEEREDAVRAAQQCAARAVRWGAATQAFPN